MKKFTIVLASTTALLSAAWLPLTNCVSTPRSSTMRGVTPVPANPENYVCEPLGQREDALLRNAIARCNSVRLNREWFSTIGADEQKWECRLYRDGEKLEPVLAHLSAEPHWYVERAKQVMFSNPAYATRIRFLDVDGKVLYDTDKMPFPCCADEHGKVHDLSDFFPFPEHP